MDKTFDSKKIEAQCHQYWQKNGYFKIAAEAGKKPSYCIVIPPPNITGILHMGHAFQHTLMDFLTRYRRMCGNDVLWQVGTDHAGIATQMVVERNLQQEEGSRHELGRDAFIDKVWQWKQHSGDKITQQMRRLGSSVDWSRERFTMDKGLSNAVTEAFVQLYRQKLIYRGKRLVNWDPQLLTAISDLEIISKEESGTMYYVRYPFVADESNGIIIGTTRPETILVDGAIAVHPDDERFTQFIGKKVWVPLTAPRRAIEIIADTHVDPEFGSGCVKITAAHDFNDYEVAQRHPDKDIPIIVLFTPDARMNDNAPPVYRGLDRFVARKNIVKDLASIGLLVDEKPHRYKLPRGDRSGAVVEPMLTDQWFVAAKKLAGAAIEAVHRGEVRFIPDNYKNIYFAWMDNIQDWCISRQLWWGHRIPAWYDEAGRCYVGHSEQAVRQHYGIDGVLHQDEDVLDTWFSSALWPFSTLNWPEEKNELARFYPTSVLVTGFDIIFFWVARMIMMSLHFTRQVPFKEVYVTGLIRDETGQKMSKSKGNIIDPLDMIDGIDLPTLIAKRTEGMMQPKKRAGIINATQKNFADGIAAHGSDALRFTLAALASRGRDINWDMKRLLGYRNFCNKLWNASRFVLMSIGDKPLFAPPKHIINRWIYSQLQRTIKNILQAINDYRFDYIAGFLHELIWHQYCDWYLEFSKHLLASEESSLKEETRSTLYCVLEQMLRLAHPLIPFITEEIWQILQDKPYQGDSIALAAYPQVQDKYIDNDSEQAVTWLKSLATAIRNIRAENQIEHKQRLQVFCRGSREHNSAYLTQFNDLLVDVLRLQSIQWCQANQPLPICGVCALDTFEVLVDIEKWVDKNQEKERLHKELEKVNQQIMRSKTKLSKQSFLKNAPELVVAEEKKRLQTWQDKATVLTKQLQFFMN